MKEFIYNIISVGKILYSVLVYHPYSETSITAIHPYFLSIIIIMKVDNPTVAICLFHKDENEFLPEWLEYHFDLGFDFIRIYDNGSKIQPENTDKIKVTHWSGDHKGRQSEAYNYFIHQYKDKIDWCLFIDTDEYLHLNKHKTIKEFIKDYNDEKCIYIHRLTYGSSFKDRITSHKELTRHGPLNLEYNKIGKSLLKLSCVDRYIKCVHNLMPEFSINVLGEREKRIVSKEAIFEVAYIKHYLTRGKEQLEEKFVRGPGQNTKESKMTNEYKAWLRDLDNHILNLHEEGELL